MRILLARVQLDPDVTIGRLSVDGAFECWTCEDTVREPGAKIPGKTAIPAGVYPIVVTWSPRFKRDLPLLVGVPGFEGVRIHPGNTAADTEGCILPGLDRMPQGVGRSRLAFDTLFAKIRAARARGEAATIEVN
jgi:hypothetical protein